MLDLLGILVVDPELPLLVQRVLFAVWQKDQLLEVQQAFVAFDFVQHLLGQTVVPLVRW